MKFLLGLLLATIPLFGAAYCGEGDVSSTTPATTSASVTTIQPAPASSVTEATPPPPSENTATSSPTVASPSSAAEPTPPPTESTMTPEPSVTEAASSETAEATTTQGAAEATTTSTTAPPPTTSVPPTTTTTTTAPIPPAPEPTTTTARSAATLIVVTISNGQVEVNGEVDARPRFEVSRGDTLEIRVTADESDEIHVHGYDHLLKFSAGEAVSKEFEASLPGVWEVELHHGHRIIFELAVS